MGRRPVNFAAVDIGNSRTKIAFFDSEGNRKDFSPPIADQVATQTRVCWYVSSVNSQRLEQLQCELLAVRPQDICYRLSHKDVPLKLDVEFPEQVGMDRLVAATAASDRASQSDLIVIDAGTAITIDAVSNRKFLGGTILPGVQTLFSSLNLETDQLPLVNQFELPDFVIGRSTVDAIRAGVMHGQVGAINQIVKQMATHLDSPQVFATGGGFETLKPGIDFDFEWASDLVVEGICLTAKKEGQ